MIFRSRNLSKQVRIQRDGRRWHCWALSFLIYYLLFLFSSFCVASSSILVIPAASIFLSRPNKKYRWNFKSLLKIFLNQRSKMCDSTYIIDKDSAETKEVLRTMSARRKIERLTLGENVLGYQYFKKLRMQELISELNSELNQNDENFLYEFAEELEIRNVNAWRNFGRKGRKQFTYLAK